MAQQKLKTPFPSIPDAELASLARIAAQLLSCQPLLTQGHRPHRLLPGQGFEFLDYREYSMGDDLRSIDWRVTARSRKPQIRRHRDELTSEWYICVDRSASMFFNQTEKWLLSCQLAIAFSYLLLHLGNRVGLLIFSDDTDKIYPATMGRTQFMHIVNGLATTPSRAGKHQSNLDSITKRLKQRTPVVVISDFLFEDGLYTNLEKLVKQDRQIHTIQVNSENETELSARGQNYLQDSETKSRRLVNLTDACIADSSRQLQRRQQQMDSFCRSRGISHTWCNTSHNWKSVILRHIKGLVPSHV